MMGHKYAAITMKAQHCVSMCVQGVGVQPKGLSSNSHALHRPRATGKRDSISSRCHRDFSGLNSLAPLLLLLYRPLSCIFKPEQQFFVRLPLAANGGWSVFETKYQFWLCLFGGAPCARINTRAAGKVTTCALSAHSAEAASASPRNRCHGHECKKGSFLSYFSLIFLVQRKWKNVYFGTAQTALKQ